MSQECGCVFIEIYREFTQNKIKNLIAFKDTVDAKEKRIKNKKTNAYVADGILHHN